MKRSTSSGVSAAAAWCALLLVCVPAAADDPKAGPRGQRFALNTVTVSVQAQRVDSCACCGVVFSDDFESGDTSAWSSSVPYARELEPTGVTPSGHRFRLPHQIVGASQSCRPQGPGTGAGT